MKYEGISVSQWNDQENGRQWFSVLTVNPCASLMKRPHSIVTCTEYLCTKQLPKSLHCTRYIQYSSVRMYSIRSTTATDTCDKHYEVCCFGACLKWDTGGCRGSSVRWNQRTKRRSVQVRRYLLRTQDSDYYSALLLIVGVGVNAPHKERLKVRPVCNPPLIF